MTVRLDELLNRARAAVLARSAGLDQTAPALPTIPELVRPVIVREAVPAVPVVRVRAESTAERLEAPSWPSCASVTESVALSRGASRVFAVLHRLAVDVARARAYAAVPNAVTFFVPALMVAALIGYTDRHLRTLVGELERAGLLDAGGHAQAVNGRWMYGGTVWCVKVKPSELPAHVTPDEWRRTWRPDFQADVEGKRGAARLISELKNKQAEPEIIYKAVLRVAVGFFDFLTPVQSSPEIANGEGPKTVREVAYLLGSGGLLGLPPGQRGHLVGVMASTLACGLDDAGWRRWYAGVILDALTAEQEGRRGLAVLAAALHRIDADRREGAPWKRCGAVLAARLKVA